MLIFTLKKPKQLQLKLFINDTSRLKTCSADFSN